LTKQRAEGLSAVGDRNRARAVVEFFRGVDTECGVNGRVEVRDRNGVLDARLAQVVGHAERAAVLQPAAREYESERRALMSATAAAIELRRPPELRRDHDER